MFGSRKDEILLKEYFEAHYDELCTVALSYVHDSEEAEDIVQDFYYVLWEKKHLKKIQGPFMAYARRAIINRCLNQLKFDSKRQPLDIADQIVDQGSEEDELRNQREDYLNILSDRLETLPDRQREVLLLSVHDDMSYKDISSRLNLSINTIKTHIKLAYKNLRAAK